MQFSREQIRKLRAYAGGENISLAEAVRRCVDRIEDTAVENRAERYRRARKLVGSLTNRDGARDVSENHDRYLDEAYR